MRKNRNRPESDEPLSEGRVEYLEAARQRVRNRRIRRTAVLLVLLTAVVLFATGIAGSSVAALKDLTDTARIALLPGSGWPQQTGVAELEQMAPLTGSFEGRNEYISRLCSFPLLILDDFGMERGTEYGLEQVYNVIDSRYRSGRPLIVTTNLTLEDLQHPEDTAHARIYDRLIEMCSPVRFTGSNFRKATAQEKMGQLKKLMNRKESRL